MGFTKCYWFGVRFNFCVAVPTAPKGRLPPASLGAANQVCSSMQSNIFDVTALNGHQDNMLPALSNKVHPVPSCPTSLCSSSMMNIREYCFSFRHLIQADLARVDREGLTCWTYSVLSSKKYNLTYVVDLLPKTPITHLSVEIVILISSLSITAMDGWN